MPRACKGSPVSPLLQEGAADLVTADDSGALCVWGSGETFRLITKIPASEYGPGGRGKGWAGGSSARQQGQVAMWSSGWLLGTGWKAKPPSPRRETGHAPGCKGEAATSPPHPLAAGFAQSAEGCGTLPSLCLSSSRA